MGESTAVCLTKQELLSFIIAHRDDYDRNVNPFASSAFLLNWIEHCADPAWRFYVVGRALLYSTPESPRAWRALTNYYSCEFSPMAPDTLDPPADIVNLRPIAETERVNFGRSWYVRRYHCFGNYYLDCSGMKFADYFASRSSQLRNTIQRKAKQFKGRLEIVRAWDERAMRAYQDVYAASWKQPEPYPDFVPDWMRVCAENGWLRLGIAWLEDQPIAAQFWFVRDGVAYIFKLAYREEFAKLSAGTLLSAALFEHVIDVDHVREVDYLSGDDAYKRAWMSERRERIGLIACNLRSPRGMLAALREFAGSLRQRFAIPKLARTG